MANSTHKKIVIAGGGFFGLYLAEQLALKGCSVTVFEKSEELMTRASYVNQARVHNGYHYPRSILTALRSRLSFPRFVEEFNECIDDDFEKYYLVAGSLSKVTGEQFKRFCQRIGAECIDATSRVSRLINPSMVEAVFATREYAFDSHKLRDIMLERLSAAKVNLLTSSTVESVQTYGNGLEVNAVVEGETENLYADHVFNCTYSRINYLLNASRVDLIPLKHEMTEMCLVEVPDEIKKMGLTVMCGPFFSVMPFPSVGFHSFSHVRYTPHYQWNDNLNQIYIDSHSIYENNQGESAWRYMVSDAQRYVPSLGDCQYQKSIWEVKTILPRSDSDDSRPILFRANHGLKGLHCVMGGKIDNIYDALQEIERVIQLSN